MLGNFVVDAMRAEYGTQLAFTVSGGLRDDLPSSYRPALRQFRRPQAGYAAGPPWDLVRGDFFAVFPFGNVAVTFRISGCTLWEALENSVSQAPWWTVASRPRRVDFYKFPASPTASTPGSLPGVA